MRGSNAGRRLTSKMRATAAGIQDNGPQAVDALGREGDDAARAQPLGRALDALGRDRQQGHGFLLCGSLSEPGKATA